MRLPATSGVVTTAVALCLLATSALPLHGQAQAPAPAELARSMESVYAGPLARALAPRSLNRTPTALDFWRDIQTATQRRPS